MRAKIKEKGAAYFEYYYIMGVNRTLIMLRDRLGELGVKTSVTTLERYSSWFSWQQQLLKRDAIAQEERKRETANIIEVMNRRQADLGSAYQSIGAGGIKDYLDALKGGKDADGNDIKPMEISPLVSAQIAQIGQKMERLARGKIADRRETIEQINNMWVLVVSQTFLAVNNSPDPRVRKEEFAYRMEQFLREQTLHLERGLG